MKKLAHGIRQGILGMRRAGGSFGEVARAFRVPLGTVKSVCSKAGLRAGMEPGPKQSMEPPCAQGAGAGSEPGRKRSMEPANPKEHRGLRVEDMPGRTNWERRMTWALFRRGEWPPPHWEIPTRLEGGDLRRRLADQAARCRPKKRRKAA